MRIARAVAERPARSLAVEGVGATSKAGLVGRFIGRCTRIDVTARRDRRLPASTGECDVTSRSTSLSAPIVNPFRDVADQIVDPEGARAARVRARRPRRSAARRQSRGAHGGGDPQRSLLPRQRPRARIMAPATASRRPAQ